ncbi:AcfA family outer membrane beta-barrel protein [Vibrio sp. 10N.261.46.A3]|uniref:AcfA family outer membrane beta-barrel protein n=1 Tax=Vibrio sp. 10N.261.46.A3 TaxID=3229658 RepID=UPI00354FC06B
MKNQLINASSLVAIALFPSLSFADEPVQEEKNKFYIGAEYGIHDVDSDYEPIVNGSELKPKSDSGFWGVYGGYNISEVWGVELSYTEFSLDAEQEKGWDDSTLEHDKDWNADLNAKSIAIMPTYQYSLQQDWNLKAGLGVSYTEYDASSNYRYTTEDHITDAEQLVDAELGPSEKEKEVGIIGLVAVNYLINDDFSVGARLKYMADGYALTSTASLSAMYAF